MQEEIGPTEPYMRAYLAYMNGDYPTAISEAEIAIKEAQPDPMGGVSVGDSTTAMSAGANLELAMAIKRKARAREKHPNPSWLRQLYRRGDDDRLRELLSHTDASTGWDEAPLAPFWPLDFFVWVFGWINRVWRSVR